MTSTSTSTAQTGIDALFGPNVEADRIAPIIEREHLEAGLIVRHKGTRKVDTNNGSSTIHSFALLALAPEEEAWFALWGSANLNSQLRKVKAGAVLLLRYAGQGTNTDGTPGPHQWVVKPSVATVQAIVTYLSRPAEHQALQRVREVIARAADADRDRRSARGGNAPLQGPPHDDDDIPF